MESKIEKSSKRIIFTKLLRVNTEEYLIHLHFIFSAAFVIFQVFCLTIIAIIH